MRVRSLVALVALLPTVLSQGDLSERIRQLEVRHAEILGRLSASEARNAELEVQLRRMALETEELRAAEAGVALETQVSGLISRVADDGWVNATRTKSPIRFYGFFRLDAYYNSARTNNVILPAFVLPENGVVARRNDAEFALDVHLTRFGLELDAGTIGDAVVRGRLETDFANFPPGVPESRETPRIRLAYIDVGFGNWTIRLGQDWDVISPLFPSVNAELLMWNAGNLGDRRPQAQIRYEGGDPDGTRFSFRLSAGLTGAVDAGDLDVGVTTLTSTEPDGFDSGHPHGQLRLGFDTPSWVDGRRLAAGAWAHVAGLETDSAFGGRRHFTPWAVGLDLELPLFSSFSLRGEVWYGAALRDMRGTIAQVIDPATGKEIEGWGGWAEVVWDVTPDFRLVAGGSIDDPRNGDVPTGGRNLNWSFYLASVYKWGGTMKSGLDLIFWETDWDSLGIGNMVRVNIYTQLDF